MNKEELKDKLATFGLDKYFDRFEPLLQNTIKLYQVATDEQDIEIGQTKIGGQPDLPPGIPWFTETSTVVKTEKKFLIFSNKIKETIVKPLSFIAQINLSEVALYDKDDLLPKTGILYFFYSAEQEAWGFDPNDRNKFKVYYFDGNLDDLARADFPTDLPVYARYKSCTVKIQAEISFPSYGHEVFEVFSEEESDSFWEEIYIDENTNKLLGYPDIIQNEMELECELVTNGLYCGDSSGYNNPKAKALKPNAKNWQLLLQIDSNEENKMMWGDCGRLYFWIRKGDLANQQFDKSWLILQCS